MDGTVESIRDEGVILFQSFLCLFSGFNFISYIFIVVCIIRHPTLQTITNYYLFSTGMAHIISQFLCIILTFKLSDLCSLSAPLAFLALLIMGMIAVFGNTVLVTIETYLKVCQPFWYARVITERKCFFLIALTWTISVGLGIAAVSGLEDDINNDKAICPFGYVVQNHGIRISIMMNIALFPPLAIITVLKVLVIRTARKKADRVEPLGGREPPPQQQPNGDIGEQLQQKFKNIRKSTINLAIFVGTYFCGWIPVLIITNVCFHGKCAALNERALIITFLAVTNLTSVGPLIYTLRQSEFSRLEKLYLQQLKGYVCGLSGSIRKKVNVNVIQPKPTAETEIGASVPQ